MRNVGVREISRKTGFSPATVSNALNRKRGVNKETAAAIFRAARELGYDRSNHITHVNFVQARKTGEILDEGTFHMGVIKGLEREAREHDLSIIFTNMELSDRQTAARKAREIVNDASSAVVLLGTEMAEEDYDLFRDAKVPFVVVDGWSDHLFFESIVTSNENSALRAVSYLIKMGHREIGYIAGTYRIKNFPLRERGYRRAMREANLPVNPDFRVEVGTTVNAAYEAMSAWLATNPVLPTAFFAENDIMAFGCMRAMTERGIKIPEDVSMLGFDDLSFASISNPPLTTMRVPNGEMGELAVKTIVDRMRSPRDYTSVVHLSTTFVERQSVLRLA